MTAFSIPPEAVDRHLRLFPPEAWVCQMVEQAKVAIGAPPCWHEAWWDWSRAAQSLVDAMYPDKKPSDRLGKIDEVG